MMAERQIRGVPSPAKLRPAVPPKSTASCCGWGAKDPHLRYQSAREVVKAMQGWLPVAQLRVTGRCRVEHPPPRARLGVHCRETGAREGRRGAGVRPPAVRPLNRVPPPAPRAIMTDSPHEDAPCYR
jgi:hypothetical protein